MKKIILAIIGVLVAVVGIGAGVFLVQREQELRERAAPATVVSLLPAQTSVRVSETFSLAISIDTQQNVVTEAEVHIAFDPNLLQGGSITSGGFLPVVLIPGTVDNTTGKASITLGVEPAQPKKGTGTLANITLRAKAAGTTTVSFLPQTQVAGLGEKGNVLVARNPASVTINPQTLHPPSPSPTASPSATPVTSPTAKPSPTPTKSPSPSPTATARPTATAQATTTAQAATSGALPVAGVSWPTITAVVAGVLLFILGILLAF